MTAVRGTRVRPSYHDGRYQTLIRFVPRSVHSRHQSIAGNAMKKLRQHLGDKHMIVPSSPG